MTDRDYLDCDSGTVITGVQTSDSGQIVRLYYRSYGNPKFNPGEPDPGKTKQRQMLTLRAVEAIDIPGEPPTIVFADETGKRYWYTTVGRITPGYAEFANEVSEPILVDKSGDDLRQVGHDVAFAVPHDLRMTPQLSSDK